ncbi:ATP-dependent DNA helicase PIF1-like [Rhizophagus irregularis DAOM 181602=DAOM 197198]|uniref:Uncharacterized protein n=1 Tax=Rhizophagus irregularis (strain DAOM 197198w) TaxID=1432141 RepID=A0A015J5A0_RHIIW|nr:hypothetical protein RirG_140440 [Rhizophagus irregularis DAOM 197198w]GBC16393.1 ATP-dependent DNA helicase PIF1-like [Rhizophagus irregularis DAOM 181602=DAOM 197198]
MWEDKTGSCSRLQFPLSLAWAITAHKLQGLTAVIDLGNKEFVAGLSFVTIFRVRSLDDILFKHFSLNRLERKKVERAVNERN